METEKMETVEVDGVEYSIADDAIIFCDETNQYELRTDVVEAYGRRGRYETCLVDNCYRFRDEWYHEDYLDDNNLCIDYNGEVASLYDVFLHSNGEYYYEEEYDEYDDDDDDDDSSLFSYHSQERVNASGDNPPFTIGFEIEKNKKPPFSFSKDEMYDEGFIMEEDGSVNGFELVTPTFNLFDEKLESKLEYIKAFCNVDDVRNCGGHIHFGINGVNGVNTVKKVQGWLPLIYAMYRGRTRNSYCTAKSVKRLLDEQCRTQSVRVLDDHVEFRVFSAVTSFTTLIWRLGLMRILAKNIDLTFEQVLIEAINQETELGAHLKLVYTDDNRFFKMLESAVGFYSNLEQGEITNISAIIAETKRQKSI